jgi:hypothetical protein
MDLAAIAAILVLIAAMVIPIFLLFRTQAGLKAKADAADAAIRAREDAALAKKQAKLDRGQGKKKKGGLARMKKGGSMLEAEAATGGLEAEEASWLTLMRLMSQQMERWSTFIVRRTSRLIKETPPENRRGLILKLEL